MSSKARQLRKVSTPVDGPTVLGKLTAEQVKKLTAASQFLETLKREAKMQIELASAKFDLALAEVERDTGMRIKGRRVNLAADGTVTLLPQALPVEAQAAPAPE